MMYTMYTRQKNVGADLIYLLFLSLIKNNKYFFNNLCCVIVHNMTSTLHQ